MEMTSKEALDRYYSNLMYGNGGFQTDEEELDGLNTIKQDLERLEELEKENQDFRYIFQAIKALGELRLEKQVNGEFTYYAIVIGDFCILIEEEQYELLKEVIKKW